MKLYRAYQKKPLTLFKGYKSKPIGYYFAPTMQIAKKWGVTLFGKGSFNIAIFEIDGNVEVIGARDGFYSEYPDMCKYFTGKAVEVKQKLLNNPLYWWIDGKLLTNDRALPEIIVRQKDIFKVSLISDDPKI